MQRAPDVMNFSVDFRSEGRCTNRTQESELYTLLSEAEIEYATGVYISIYSFLFHASASMRAVEK